MYVCMYGCMILPDTRLRRSTHNFTCDGLWQTRTANSLPASQSAGTGDSYELRARERACTGNPPWQRDHQPPPGTGEPSSVSLHRPPHDSPLPLPLLCYDECNYYCHYCYSRHECSYTITVITSTASTAMTTGTTVSTTTATTTTATTY